MPRNMRPPKKPKPRKASKPKKDPRPQRERFIEFAKEVGADRDDGGLERTFKQTVPPKRPRS